jgi:hypothetical protein
MGVGAGAGAGVCMGMGAGGWVCMCVGGWVWVGVGGWVWGWGWVYVRALRATHLPADDEENHDRAEDLDRVARQHRNVGRHRILQDLTRTRTARTCDECESLYVHKCMCVVVQDGQAFHGRPRA